MTSSKITKQITSQDLELWDVPTDKKIDYYDGKILVVSDSDPESPFLVASKAGVSALFGISVFVHAPLVAVVFFGYTVFKVAGTITGLYDDTDKTLTNRLAQDLGIELEDQEVEEPKILDSKPERVEPKREPEKIDLPPYDEPSQPIEKSQVSIAAVVPEFSAIPDFNIKEIEADKPEIETSQAIIEIQPEKLEVIGTNASSQTSRIVHQVPSNDPVDIAESLAVNLQSTLIVGQPGSGKGYAIAMATRAVKKLHPDVVIWAIDPKADESESHYWEAVDHYLPVKINPFTDDKSMVKIMKSISDFIQEFQDSDGAKLLVFDEALAVKEKTGRWFKGLMAGFNALCSMGRSRRQYGWLISQSPNTDDFGISGGVRNVYRRILLISADNLGLLDNGSTYFSGKPSDDNLKPTGRAFFDSLLNRWEAVPFYEIPEMPIIPIDLPEIEPVPSGFSVREQFEREYQMEMETQEPIRTELDLAVDLLKKASAFIRDPLNQDAEGWVKISEFIKLGSSAEMKRKRKMALGTLKRHYSAMYEYRKVNLIGGNISEQIRAIS